MGQTHDGEGHAVVLGAGMSGLLAARALAPYFERVTVVERDTLPDAAVPRKGVPHGRHTHGLLARGGEVLERLMPGIGEELTAAGALRARSLLETRHMSGGERLAGGDADSTVVLATRPLLESVVRRRVAALPQVTIADEHDVVGPVSEAGRITGVRVAARGQDGAEEVLGARLVVDAMGRAGRSVQWLTELGCAAPTEDRIKVDLGYSSRMFRLPPDVFGRDEVVVSVGVPGHPTRGLAAHHQEGDRWMVTLAGMAGDHPGSDEEAFLGFARTTAPADVADALDKGEALTPISKYRFPDGVRRRFEQLEAPPEGLLAVGDAMCSFNPLYGQGMTIAALEALELESCLASGGEQDLPRRYYRAAAGVVDNAWEMAVGADLAVPQVPGRRSVSRRITRRYTDMLTRAACRDADVAVAFTRVTGLQDPPTRLFAPRVAARVLKNSLVGGR